MAVSELWLFKGFVFLCLIRGNELHRVSSTSGTSSADSGTLVRTSYGLLRGFEDDRSGVLKYYGVPFAEAPIGTLRFKQPTPPRPWSGIRDATQFGARCLQRGFSSFMSEDCLFLNIYSPSGRSNSAGTFPVMVWIHGGGYIVGSGQNHDGTALARKGVVVVTINYRLDIFGFMSAEDDVIPGNFGMLDQIQALKWIKQNIASFRGDPNRVTIFGESAGSGSVSLLILSPLAKGLFQRAIMQSGTSLSPWAMYQPATRMSPNTFARLVGASSGCNQNSSVQFLQCMQSRPATMLLRNRYSANTPFNSRRIMNPRVENSFGFLPDLPINLLRQGRYNHVDTIRGYNTHERGLVIPDPEWGVTRQRFQEEVRNTFIPYFVSVEGRLMNYLEDMYLGYTTDPMLILQGLSAFRTDYAFVGPTLSEIQLASSTSPEKKHYLYEFNYRPSYSSLPSWVTAIHSDEIEFVFGLHQFLSRGAEPTQNDLIVSEQMMTMWTNFAKTGNPTSSLPYGAVRWAEFTPFSQRLLKINNFSSLTRFEYPQVVDLYSQILQMLMQSRVVSTERLLYY